VAPPFRAMTLEDFDREVDRYAGPRRIDSVHMHHTWRPNHAQYSGEATIVGMWRHHTQQNGWDDIAQHVSIAPDGTIWSGRPWDKMPASSTGFNGTGVSGPFMFEIIGDFDAGCDPLDGDQKEAVLHVIATLMSRFDLAPPTLRFHRQLYAPNVPAHERKSCPGTAIDYEVFLGEVRARLGR
jgi:hypothetical protein